MDTNKSAATGERIPARRFWMIDKHGRELDVLGRRMNSLDYPPRPCPECGAETEHYLICSQSES